MLEIQPKSILIQLIILTVLKYFLHLVYIDNMLLDTYAPLERINKYKLKFKSKPWITVGLQFTKINICKKQVSYL